MVTSPSAAHESVLSAIIRHLHFVLLSLPVSASILTYQISTNWPIEGPSIYTIPDLTILEITEGGTEDRPLCFMESVFLQIDKVVMDKLQNYVSDHPDVLMVGKILMKQAMPYHSPGLNGSLVPHLWSSELMMQTKWKGDLGPQDFALVVIDEHTWFSLLLVEIHVWTREDGPIDVDCLDSNRYTFRVCCSLIYCG